MTKRYSETLRERAERLRESVVPDVTSDIVNEPWSEGDCAACGAGIRLARGYPTRGAQICEGCEVDAKARACAFDEIADELDSPEFSGRIVYEQRNAALEDAKRWEAEAKEWKRLCLELESQILVDLWGHQVSSELTERFHAIRVKQHGTDETYAEDDNG